jgi:hypothetical protein
VPSPPVAPLAQCCGGSWPPTLYPRWSDATSGCDADCRALGPRAASTFSCEAEAAVRSTRPRWTSPCCPGGGCGRRCRTRREAREGFALPRDGRELGRDFCGPAPGTWAQENARSRDTHRGRGEYDACLLPAQTLGARLEKIGRDGRTLSAPWARISMPVEGAAPNMSDAFSPQNRLLLGRTPRSWDLAAAACPPAKTP